MSKYPIPYSPTKLEYFAGQAMTGLLNNPTNTKIIAEMSKETGATGMQITAGLAISQANELIKQLSEQEELE